ncbi:hypothetical protein C0991_004789 [Blastosporella zonata]|nr:hypothetical protein C0991_004789 [Blastosporella zonata]
MNNDYPPQRQQWASDHHYSSFQPPTALSLNLSSLTVTSPPSASPISGAPSSPVSPSYPTYQFDPTAPATYDDHPPYDNRRTPGPSRSSSATSSSSHLPRKRSFTSTPVLEENILYDDAPDAHMDILHDDIDIRYTTTANASPVEGSDNSEADHTNSALTSAAPGGVGGTMNILGKPLATNNFVTKLYQMINDAKSAHYIAWTEIGTSFVVSNVGEFSRSILGSHFKHNNFSSFVRQLNMYGFHKINRTPRAQRTSTDAQTWEFSHHKFLRGRPDLLDEIKRKALEPDPALKHRVELPGEVAAQLNAMRDDNRRVWEQLNIERKRSEHLAGALQRLWEFISQRMGGLPPFPPDLLDVGDSPNIYITSPGQPSASGIVTGGGGGGGGKFAPPPLSMNNVHMGALHTMHSPGSGSPTQSEFGGHHQGSGGGGGGPTSAGPPSLSRQHSFQHVSYLRGDASPMPGSPGSTSMDLYDDSEASHSQTQRISSKRPRISTDDDGSHQQQHSHHVVSHPQHHSPHHHSPHHHPHTHPHQGHYASHGSAPPSAHPDSHPHINPLSSSINSLSSSINSLSSLSSINSLTPISSLSSSIPQHQHPHTLISPSSNGARKPSRARSDSAPLGYGFGLAVGQGGMWGGAGGRPRSGSGLAGRGVPNLGIPPNIGNPNGVRPVASGGLGGGGGLAGGLGGAGLGGGGMGPGGGVQSVQSNALR